MLTFGTSVAINNLTALRYFYTFIFNYILHDKPTWLERQWLPRLKEWIEDRALVVMNELVNDKEVKNASVALNDVSSDFFAALYIAIHPETVVNVKQGGDLFLLLAQMALEFEKVKKPRADVQHGS